MLSMGEANAAVIFTALPQLGGIPLDFNEQSSRQGLS
jgi:hypothetical protein